MCANNEAKKALDAVIGKSRVHFYKPIQIAEILYRDRIHKDIDLEQTETYRTKSKKWRDDICKILLNRVSTSSAKYQDDIFTAIPAKVLARLGKENRKTNGAVEAYIYREFYAKHDQLKAALSYCTKSKKKDFNVTTFINAFWAVPGLKRSLDKIYEIVVHSLFSTIVETLEMKVEISLKGDKMEILKEFEDFTKSVMCIDFSNPVYIQKAKIYRVGVTNASDRGLDMYSNWGPAIQIKHLSLDEGLAQNIVGGISSDKIVIVCKNAEKNVILSLLTQIGWKCKIQSIITEADLTNWYDKALRGKYASDMGDKLLQLLAEEINYEFPSISTSFPLLEERNYNSITNTFWR